MACADSSKNGNPSTIPPPRRRGRGAISNASGRFEALTREAADDGWGSAEAEAEEPRLRTEITIDAARSVIARNQSPDVPFDRSINPYRGCEHGCVYCFARPTHAFLGLSPGLDFETKLFVKPNAAERLTAELARRGYRPAPIAIGTNTDPYQPVERDQRVMRSILEVLWECRHPVTIVTKGALILRDIDILRPMAAEGLARAALSVTTLDPRLARAMEPRASTPARRLEAVRALSAAGVPTGVMVAPVIPGLTDHEVEAILAAARAAGAVWADYVTLRLPLEVSSLFQEWLAEARPLRAKKVMNRVRAMQGGKDYDPEWGARMRGRGPEAGLIAKRFETARRRCGLGPKPLGELRTDLFRRPRSQDDGQLAFDL